VLGPNLAAERLLPSLAPGDEVRVTVQQWCQPYSGCRSFLILRNALDDRLITAEFNDYPADLSAFGELLGVGISIEPTCAAAPISDCHEHEVQTQYRLLVDADDAVRIDAHSHPRVNIEGRPYTLWFGDAYSNASDDPPIPGRCVDSGSFWWPGALSLTITP
jgi:hypothetical protein